jgi:uncharacterized delta-60 repeat protein
VVGATLLLSSITAGLAQAAPGELDPSFGNNGVLSTGAGYRASAMAIDHLGRLVIAYDASGDAEVMRRLPDGSVDESFGDHGVAVTYGLTSLSSVAVDADDRVVVAGYSETSNYEIHMNLVRFTESGDLDSNFDGNGSLGLGDTYVGQLNILPNGHILFGGDPGSGSVGRGSAPRGRAVLLQLNEDGSRDTKFGDNGVVTVRMGPSSGFIVVLGIVVGPGGKVYALASDISYGGTFDGVLRLLPDGNLDQGFASNGVARVDSEDVRNVALDVDRSGGVVLAGTKTVIPDGGFNNDAQVSSMLTRLTEGGTLDAAFGSGGREEFAASAIYIMEDVDIQANGRILASGSSFPESRVDPHFAIARFNPSGGFDQDFAGSGVATLDEIGYGQESVLDARGDIFQMGSARSQGPSGTPQGVVVAKYEGDGLDDDGTDDSGGGVAGEVGGSIGFKVHRYAVPRSFSKLLSNGVRALVGCKRTCRVELNVRTSNNMAATLGLRSTLVATGSRLVGAGKKRWVRARFSGTARRAMFAFGATGHLRIKARGLTP